MQLEQHTTETGIMFRASFKNFSMEGPICQMGPERTISMGFGGLHMGEIFKFWMLQKPFHVIFLFFGISLSIRLQCKCVQLTVF
jgi:hypothetical protein